MQTLPKQNIKRGMHPNHCVQTIKSIRGFDITLTAAVYPESNGKSEVDIWGRVNNGNPLRPPRNPDKSSAEKCGGVEAYLKSPTRELFYHITLGQYLGFKLRALNFILAT